MKYKKIEVGPYNLHFINTDKFKKISISIKFKRKIKKEEITIRNMLYKILLESNKKYPKSRLIQIETENLYNLYLGSSISISGNYSIINFESSFLEDKYAEEGLTKKSIEFINSFIFEPNVIDNKFDSKTFELVKENLKEQIKSIKENPNMYGYLRLLEETDKKSSISYNPYGYLEDLEKITAENLYEYYKSVLNSDIIDIFIEGNIDDIDIKEIINKTFKIKTLKRPSESHFLEYKNYRKKNKIVHEQNDTEQSKLFIACKMDELTDFEKKYVMPIYASILGGGANSRLFRTVREENSLCYSISASNYPIVNLLIIRAGINKEDFRKCLRLIKKELKNMEKGAFSKEELNASIMTTKTAYKKIEDSPFSIINIYASHHYLNFDLLDKRKENISKVTKEMIIELAKKIHVDTVYILEGGSK